MRKMILAACVLTSSVVVAAPVAFPGAEGFGAMATGGRGGAVVHVTTLDDSGPGSLRDAVSKPDRTVVFDVGGVIRVKSQIAITDNITIAGQTAPGGIAIFGGGISMSKHSNIIVRYLTVRSGIASGKGSKSMNIAEGSNIILDHLSIGWGRWDNCGITEKSENITMQNCLIHEAIGPQQFGMLLDSSRHISILRNLWINNRGRNPKDKGDVQFINNVIYNWGNQGYGGGHSAGEWNEDVVGNYMIAGPDSNNSFFSFVNENDHVYSNGNMVDLDKDGTLNGRAWTEDDLTKADPKTKEGATPSAKPYNVPEMAVTVLSAEDALKGVIAGVGNSLYRDAVDQRQIDQLKSFGKAGTNPKEEADVGGMPAADKPMAALKDTDGDGIPDEWEKSHGLNPADPSDGKSITAGGYTPLETYLNEIAAK